MIDVSKCEFEECSLEGAMGHGAYFFIYPKEYADDFGVRFKPFDSYDGEVVSLCVLLVDYGDGFRVVVFPTIENEDCLCDIDWHDVDEVDDDTIQRLLQIANNQGGSTEP